MPYTFVPKHRYAKAYGNNMKISAKSAATICRVIRNKPLTRVKRLLNDLVVEKRSLEGKYYTKTVDKILSLLNSCEKNAEFMGLETERLFVHASAHKGTNFKRKRRKAAFGSKMKTTNLEIMLIERGKESKTKIPKKKIKEQIKAQTRERQEEEIKSAETVSQ